MQGQCCVTAILELTTYAEAMALDDAVLWMAAMHDKMALMHSNNVFVLAPRLPRCKPVRAQWLYKIKYKADGSIDHYKARWVAKGYSQRYSIDYDDTYAPVVRIEHLQLLLMYAATLGLDVHQLNVVTAFLQADLCELIYADQPEGFESIEHPTHVCRLIKSLYGLKQALLTWNLAIDSHLHDSGFIPMDADPCIYV